MKLNSKMKSARLAKLFARALIFTLVTILVAPSGLAANANVDIELFDFNPANVTINVNEQVIWTWVSDFHDTMNTNGLWDSGIHNTGYIFTNTFNSPGRFPYLCTVHGFGGSVTVQASANIPPSVTITILSRVAFLAPPPPSLSGLLPVIQMAPSPTSNSSTVPYRWAMMPPAHTASVPDLISARIPSRP